MFLFDANIIENKKIKIALQAIYGLGKKNSIKIIKKCGFAPNLTIKFLNNFQLTKIIKIINSLNILLGNELKKNYLFKFKQLLKIKLLKSLRTNLGLPVRGQRTHTNAKTAKKQQKIFYFK